MRSARWDPACIRVPRCMRDGKGVLVVLPALLSLPAGLPACPGAQVPSFDRERFDCSVPLLSAGWGCDPLMGTSLPQREAKKRGEDGRFMAVVTLAVLTSSLSVRPRTPLAAWLRLVPKGKSRALKQRGRRGEPGRQVASSLLWGSQSRFSYAARALRSGSATTARAVFFLLFRPPFPFHRRSPTACPVVFPPPHAAAPQIRKSTTQLRPYPNPQPHRVSHASDLQAYSSRHRTAVSRSSEPHRHQLD